MHEMSLCEGVIQLIEQQADEQDFNKVTTVWLEIGALAGVEVEAMRFSFDAIARNTIADAAKLEIIHVQGHAACPLCKQQTEVSARFDLCPACGHYPLNILAGEEMRIKELEVQ
ncbi:hydrogenase maturation nickel metallochaperone HypA [Mariprofundus sp. EBB-1]|uniref:hydrogenase maturation nickel metallochaperone HypA n=1 Tax=Mariprofundus sp. EBB-1 TaxID=2650971 RepID=UPI000EF21070|nr:hydrogenase maturation nickel metallochaperone HypA [Mariprofundus sp. EBB-1]RLL54328.1 hydrogenase maturation nickel metallochaperone HypA [Mariprofundus sp. EBB-1]